MFGVPLKLYWLQFCTSLTIQLKSFSNVGLSPPLSVLSTTIFMTIRLNSFKIQNVFNFYFSLCAAKRLNHFQILTRPFFLIRFPAVNWYKFKETTIFMHVGGKRLLCYGFLLLFPSMCTLPQFNHSFFLFTPQKKSTQTYCVWLMID